MSREHDVGVRAWTEPDDGWGVWSPRRPDPQAEASGDRAADRDEVLVFAVSSAGGWEQRLGCLAWRLYAHDTLVEEGIAHPDEHTAPAAPPGTTVMTLSEWLDSRFHHYGYKRQAVVVAMHLGWSLSRLANRDRWDRLRVGRRNGPFAGGFRLYLFGGPRHDDPTQWHTTRYRHDLLVTHLGRGVTFYGWSSSLDDRLDGRVYRRGRFVDLATAAYAMGATEETSLTAVAADLGVDIHTDDGLDEGSSCCWSAGVAARTVAECFFAIRNMAATHRVPLALHRLHSPAGLVTAYLGEMGLRPPLERNPEFPRRVLGAGMAAFHGGRVEVNRSTLGRQVPTVWLDLASTYPAICVHKGLWRYLVAERLEVLDATAEVRTELETPDLAQRWLRPQTHAAWGVTLVRVAHDGTDPLPRLVHRVATPKGWRNRLGPLDTAGRDGWWSLDDVIASAISTGKAPKVAEAVRVVPVGVQPSLRPVVLPSGRRFDPGVDDFYEALISERHQAEAAGETSLSSALKGAANAGTWGLCARVDQGPRAAEPQHVNVWDGSDDAPRRATVDRLEPPGPWSFPPLASVVTGAARLALAQVEHLVAAGGGTWVTMDTDSVAVVATPTGGTAGEGDEAVDALSFAQVEALRDAFVALGGGQSWWKVEHDSLEVPTWTYCAGLKTYAVYRTPAGSGPLERGQEPVLVAGTTFGLEGTYLAPTPGAEPVAGMPAWVAAAWTHKLRVVAGEGAERRFPDWWDTPALRPQAYTTPRLVAQSGLPGAWPFNTYLAGQLAYGIATDPHRSPCIPKGAEGGEWLDHATGELIVAEEGWRPVTLGRVVTATILAPGVARLAADRTLGDHPASATVVRRRVTIGREQGDDDEVLGAAPAEVQRDRAAVMAVDVLCRQCSRPVEEARTGQRYHGHCAEAGRKAAQRARGRRDPAARRCACCGAELPARSPKTKRFCDDTCRKDADRNGTEGRCPVPGCRNMAASDRGMCGWCRRDEGAGMAS